jgi:acyl dehydratase
VSTGDYGMVTDDSLARVRAWIGVPRRERGWNSVASADAIWHFAQGVGDDNPLWWDDAYAEGTRWGRMMAPPLFLSTCNNAGLRVGEDGIYPAEHWLPGTVPIWVSDRWVFHRPTWAGERVTATAELVSVEERPGRDNARAATHVDRTSYSGEDGSLIAECFKTLNRYDRNPDRVAVLSPEALLPTYTDEDLAAIAAQYDHEGSARRGADTLYGDDVHVGQNLPVLVKGPLTITGIVGFVMGWGSPLCPTNRIAHRYLDAHPGARLHDDRMNVGDTLEGPHWEPHLARKGGMGGCYDFGAQRVCWLGHLLTDWCGDDGFVSALEVRLRRPNLVGDTTWLGGEVTATREVGAGDDGLLVDCALRATNQRGEETAVGTATVRLPRRTGATSVPAG